MEGEGDVVKMWLEVAGLVGCNGTAVSSSGGVGRAGRHTCASGTFNVLSYSTRTKKREEAVIAGQMKKLRTARAAGGPLKQAISAVCPLPSLLSAPDVRLSQTVCRDSAYSSTVTRQAVSSVCVSNGDRGCGQHRQGLWAAQTVVVGVVGSIDGCCGCCGQHRQGL